MGELETVIAVISLWFRSVAEPTACKAGRRARGLGGARQGRLVLDLATKLLTSLAGGVPTCTFAV